MKKVLFLSIVFFTFHFFFVVYLLYLRFRRPLEVPPRPPASFDIVSSRVRRTMLALLLQASGYVLSPAVLRVTPAPQPSATSHVNVAMNWLAGAFANDDSLGARENAGLSKEKAKKTITWVGPNGQSKKSIVVPGQKLRDIARVSDPAAARMHRHG